MINIVLALSITCILSVVSSRLVYYDGAITTGANMTALADRGGLFVENFDSDGIQRVNTTEISVEILYTGDVLVGKQVYKQPPQRALQPGDLNNKSNTDYWENMGLVFVNITIPAQLNQTQMQCAYWNNNASYVNTTNVSDPQCTSKYGQTAIRWEKDIKAFYLGNKYGVFFIRKNFGQDTALGPGFAAKRGCGWFKIM